MIYHEVIAEEMIEKMNIFNCFIQSTSYAIMMQIIDYNMPDYCRVINVEGMDCWCYKPETSQHFTEIVWIPLENGKYLKVKCFSKGISCLEGLNNIDSGIYELSNNTIIDLDKIIDIEGVGGYEDNINFPLGFRIHYQQRSETIRYEWFQNKKEVKEQRRLLIIAWEKRKESLDRRRNGI